jgi:hypothetical protein
MSLVGVPMLGADGAALIDAALLGVVAWHIFRLSLPWSVAGLLLFLGGRLYRVMNIPSAHGNVMVGIVLFFCYVNAVRGGLYLRSNPVALDQAPIPSN